MITPTILAQLATEIHTDNVKMGWWTDIRTGESILATRNRPEMLMLGVSELAEAAEGLDRRPDDKLPHLPMFDVELADFAIRQLDQIGAEVSLGMAPMPAFDYKSWDDYRFDPYERRACLLYLVGVVAEAMEHYRKGRVADYVETMAKGVVLTFEFANRQAIDLADIIAQKRLYNATRADHKVENRLGDEGKRF